MNETALRDAPSRVRTVVKGFLGITVLALLYYFGLMRPESQGERRAENERSAASALKSLCTLEAAIRAHDLDGNGAADYWTGDIAGMRRLFPANNPAAGFLTATGHTKDAAMALMDLAQADPSRSDAKPFQGYWFVPLDSDVDGKPFRLNGRPHHPTSFGYCAFPAESGVGRSTFLISEWGQVFKINTGTRTTKMPSDRELQMGWWKVG